MAFNYIKRGPIATASSLSLIPEESTIDTINAGVADKATQTTGTVTTIEVVEGDNSLSKIGAMLAQTQNDKRSTGIEWTQHTWNPFVGCSVHTAGCTNCYAMKQAAVISAQHYNGVIEVKNGNPVWTGKLNLAPAHILNKPDKIKGKALIFVNSMSDFFHEKAERAWQAIAFNVMRRNPQHIFQVLTKRPENIDPVLMDLGPPPPNVWIGVTVERADTVWRIDTLRKVPAAVRFISFEPLIGPVGKIDLTGIHWSIIGGESGDGARIIKLEWVTEIINQAIAQGSAPFFKQWGTYKFNPLMESHSLAEVKKMDPIGKGGSLVNGIEYKQFPQLS